MLTKPTILVFVAGLSLSAATNLLTSLVPQNLSSVLPAVMFILAGLAFLVSGDRSVKAADDARFIAGEDGADRSDVETSKLADLHVRPIARLAWAIFLLTFISLAVSVLLHHSKPTIVSPSVPSTTNPTSIPSSTGQRR